VESRPEERQPRPKRAEKQVLDWLARMVRGGELRDGDTVVVDVAGSKLTFLANLAQAPLVA
jgi:hypothetical protein